LQIESDAVELGGTGKGETSRAKRATPTRGTNLRMDVI